MNGRPLEPSPKGGRASEGAVSVRLLGAFSVAIGGSPVPEGAFARKKARDLLKLLALDPGHNLHRDRAMDLLWPDLDPQAASAQLYKAVHQIRQGFTRVDPAAGDVLRFREGLLTLAAPGGIETDVATFERLAGEASRSPTPVLLARAVAAYAGDLLPSDLYEEWTLERRESLRERFLDLLGKLAESYADAGRLAEAADVFRQVLGRDPSREAAHRGLMHTYALLGSRDRAAHQYRVCARTLQTELGVEPSAETTALHREIVREGIEPLRLVEQFSTFPPPVSPLVGRERELSRLVELLDGVGTRPVGSVTLEGPAGIGKTRLAQEVVQLAHLRGYHALYGSAHEREGQLPYAPVIDALRMAVRSDRSGAELIPAELAAAIPDVEVGSRVPSADRLAAQHALFAGVLRFLRARARAVPLVLVLDDLHTADEGSLKLFHYLARQAGDLRLLVLGSWRTEDPAAAPALGGLVDSLSRRAALVRLVLEPLTEPEHEALIAQCLGGGEVDPSTAAAIYRLSLGNPLFTAEMVRQLADGTRLVRTEGTWRLDQSDEEIPLPIPSSLQSILQDRLARLTVAARRVLDLACVVGQTASLSVLRAGAVTGDVGVFDFPSLLDLLDEAQSARLLEETGLTYRFRHPLLREAIHRGMSSGRRQFLHRHVAATLELMHPSPQERPVEALAHHYREAGDVDQAVRYLTAAGDRAEAVYDHDGALARYREGLALLTARAGDGALHRAELHERIGDVHQATGDVSRSLEAYRQALALLRENGAEHGSLEGGLHRKVVLAAITAADVPTAAEHLRLAWTGMDEQRPLELARVLVAQAFFDWHMNKPEESVEHAGRALQIAEEQHARTEAGQASQMLAAAHFLQGNWEEGLRYESRLGTDWSPELAVAVDAHLCGFDVRIHGAGQYERAERFIRGVADRAATIGNLRCLAVAHYALGSMAVLRCRFQIAQEHLARSLELHEGLGSPAGVAYTLARQVQLMTARGDPADASGLIRRGLDAGEQVAIRMHALARVCASGIRSRMNAGDLEMAKELGESARAVAEGGRICPVCSPELLPALGELFVVLGHVEQAWGLAEAAHQISGMVGNQAGSGQALALEGRVHLARGQFDDARAAFSQAVSTLRPLDQPYELARTLEAWAAAPGAHRAKREAEVLLSQLRG